MHSISRKGGYRARASLATLPMFSSTRGSAKSDSSIFTAPTNLSRSAARPPAGPSRRSPATSRRFPRRIRSRRPEFCPAGLCGRDIFAHRPMLVFQLLEPIFDHVADRHDANQSLVENDREMAAAPDGHFSHGQIDGFVLMRGNDRRRHMFRHGIVERGRAPSADRMNDIALPQNSKDAALRVGDYNRPNVTRRQNSGGLGQGPVWLGGNDILSLGRENACDSHP